MRTPGGNRGRDRARVKGIVANPRAGSEPLGLLCPCGLGEPLEVSRCLTAGTILACPTCQWFGRPADLLDDAPGVGQ